MKKEKLKEILIKIYSKDSVKSILLGRMRPTYTTMCDLNKLHNIPFEAWLDIKSYINSNKEDKTTSSAMMEKNTPKDRYVR